MVPMRLFDQIRDFPNLDFAIIKQSFSMLSDGIKDNRICFADVAHSG